MEKKEEVQRKPVHDKGPAPPPPPMLLESNLHKEVDNEKGHIPPPPPVPFPVLPTPPASPLTPPITPPIPQVPLVPPITPPATEKLHKTIEPNVNLLSQDLDKVDTTTSTKASSNVKDTLDEIILEEKPIEKWTSSDTMINEGVLFNSNSEDNGNLIVVSTPQTDRNKMNTSTVTIITDSPDPSNSLAANISQVIYFFMKLFVINATIIML